MTAITIVAETRSLSRFKNARQLMSYSGLVSSGHRIQRGAITKAGKAHLRESRSRRRSVCQPTSLGGTSRPQKRYRVPTLLDVLPLLLDP